jgi:type II secretory pathway pseudopilin PulG
MTLAHARRSPPEAGWSLVEILVVLLIIGTAAAVAALATPLVVTLAKGDSGSSQVAATLSTARELAISQRRNIRVDFEEPNRIVVLRVELPDAAGVTPDPTVLSTVTLENGIQFLQFDGVDDTPDGFGSASAASFGNAENVAFTSEGTLVDHNGDEINGTVFLGVPDRPETARAVTIFGPTALVRQWTWLGDHWVD